MKSSTIYLLSLVTFASIQFSADAAPVTIEVTKVTDSEGPIVISLFATSESWDKEAPSSVLKLPVTVDTSTLQIDLPEGDYAFFLYQDLNGDGMLKKSGFGFPAEPYAFSNNRQIKFSKPSWDQLKFTVDSTGAKHSVSLNHP